ncbi:hypothetical protein PS664_00027 [Pseudomonas fluorescens]|nr:hypothetical protein PS664_00027 [Pseudomonas fluorescens]
MGTFFYAVRVGDTGETQEGHVTADSFEEAEEKIRALYKCNIEIVDLASL